MPDHRSIFALVVTGLSASPLMAIREARRPAPPGSVVIGAAAPIGELATARQEVPGHYRFRVLDAAGDSVVAEGEFVLGAEPFAALPMASDTLERIVRRSSRLGGREQGFTTCFGVRSSPRYVEGREFYIGIIRNGVSSWSLNTNGQLVVRLYQSPDASAALVGDLRGDRIVGRMHQSDWNPSSDKPVEWLPFEAERIGDASPDACVRVLTLGDSSETP